MHTPQHIVFFTSFVPQQHLLLSPVFSVRRSSHIPHEDAGLERAVRARLLFLNDAINDTVAAQADAS